MTGEADRNGGHQVCGVLVTYRRPELLARTLSVLRAQTRPLAHIIVVDNDLDESARPALTDATTYVSYLPTGVNLGPAGGLRAGVEEAVGRFEWVMFLDDDDPPPGADVVESMTTFLELALAEDRNCAGVGAAGALFDARRAVSRRPTMNSPSRMLAVDWIGGGQFPIYRVAALAEVGAPDPALFWGYDDLDLGLRLRGSGYSLYRDRDYEVRTPFDHPKKVESGPAVPWRRYYTTRNLVAIMIRESTRLRATAIGLRCVAGALVGAKGRRLRTALSAARGLTDGLRGSSGWSARAGGPDR